MTPILCYHPPSGMPVFEGEGLPQAGVFVYWPDVNILTINDPPPTGDPNYSGVPVILQEQHISALPNNAIVVVMIYGRGTSHWKRTVDRDDPLTEEDIAGVIVPVDYDPDLNPVLLHRVAGF